MPVEESTAATSGWKRARKPSRQSGSGHLVWLLRLLLSSVSACACVASMHVMFVMCACRCVRRVWRLCASSRHAIVFEAAALRLRLRLQLDAAPRLLRVVAAACPAMTLAPDAQGQRERARGADDQSRSQQASWDRRSEWLQQRNTEGWCGNSGPTERR